MNFVFDIDGTISFKDNHIHEAIVNKLKEAPLFNHQVIFATARSYRDSVPVLGETLKCQPVIGINGGVVYEQGKLVTQQCLDWETYDKLVTFCKRNRLPYFVDEAVNYSCQYPEKIPFFKYVNVHGDAQQLPIKDLKNPIKMVIVLEGKVLTQELLHFLSTCYDVDVLYHDIEKCLYINPAYTNKASSLKNYLGQQDYICFGNDKNDIELFEQAMYSVQVGDYADLAPYAHQQLRIDDSITERLVATIDELFRRYG